MRSSRLLGRGWQILREEGIRSFGAKLFAKLFRYRRMFILGRPLTDSIQAVASSLPLTVAWLSPTEAEEIVALEPSDTARSVRNRFQRGDRCLGARHDGRLVAILWASLVPMRIRHLDRDVPLASGEVYLYGAFTAPDFRGKSIAPFLCAALLRHYQASGYHRAIRATHLKNKTALRAHAKAGFHQCALIGYVQIGPWRWDFCRPINHRPAAPG